MQVPQESLESHDTDEMDMSDDEASSSRRYGKRARADSKVKSTFFTTQNNFQTPSILMKSNQHNTLIIFIPGIHRC